MTVSSESLNGSRTLREFLDLTPPQLSKDFSRSALTRAAQAEKSVFRTWMKADGSQKLPKQMADHLCNALDMSLVSIFAGFWNTRNELRQCARETREDTSRSSDLDVASHSFTHELMIDIDVLLNGSRVATIPFSVETSFTVKALTLSIRRGAVYKIRSGGCECEAEIHCGELAVWHSEPLQISMPSEFKLHQPIDIDD